MSTESAGVFPVGVALATMGVARAGAAALPGVGVVLVRVGDREGAVMPT